MLPVVDTLEYEPDHLEAQQDDDKGGLILLDTTNG